MAKKSGGSRLGGLQSVPTWARVLIGLVLLLFGLHWVIVSRIEEFGDSLVNAARVFTSASHRGAYYTWRGDLGIRGLRIESPAGGGALLQVDRLELETPGWGWTLRAIAPWSGGGGRARRGMSTLSSGDGGLPSASSLHVHLKGVEFDMVSLLPAGTPEPGLASGVPFETAGCSGVRYFVDLNLRDDLGLRHRGADLSVGYRSSPPDRVLVEARYEVANVASVLYEMEMRSSDSGNFLDALDFGERPLSYRVVLQDLGFNRARNAWCAEKAGIDDDEFQRRHITAVRRLLEVFGVAMSPETEASYQQWARDGGSLELQFRPELSASPAVLAQYTPQQAWAVMAAQIRHGDEPFQPMTLEFVPARPLPQAYAGSVYDLLARQTDDASGDTTESLTSLGQHVSDVLQGRSPPSGTGSAPRRSEESRQAALAARSRAEEPVPVALDTASLRAAIGQRVQIEAGDGMRRVGELLSVDEREIVLKVNFSGGSAELSFSRERLIAVHSNPRGR